MKKIINNISISLLLLASFCFLGCTNKEKQNQDKSTSDTALKVQEVVAIGKVAPAEGWIQISSPSNGLIEEILVKEGDQVEKGQTLLKLKQSIASLDVEQARAELESLKANNQVNRQDLEKEKILLAELKSKYETSKNLYSKNAETRENVESDLSNYKQQQEKINSINKQIQSNRFIEKEQRIQIEKSQQTLNDLKVVAVKNGIISELNAEVGQSVISNDNLGTMVENHHYLIEAEVDELFADSVQVGQIVEMNMVGKTAVISKGKIIYVSPTLVNKSILFETANEAEDRRVRRIKIEPDNSSNLLINAKVECRIKIK
ncbi:HlyD family secretion protein [Sphingobacterium endophyticum]|uniref:HlyD family secretion protein n=1 Tax=Sphingobacterium endophyticum TaxID=2546448 RepID=UPI0018CE791E|nr:efflux RND transporter periplasmic adaptor subunit [Sphingobacterium endophyticum]